MSLMALPAALQGILKGFRKEAEPVKYFIALRVSSQFVSSTSWQITDGNVEIGKVDSTDLPSGNPEQLLLACDKVVSHVTEGISPEPKEVLFGIPPNWAEGGKIKDPYLLKLRNLSKELELTPLGFVVLPEAIANYYHQTETVPLTAILIGMDGENLSVTLVRAGKVIQTETEQTQESIGINELVEQALKKFIGVEILPSRILIYDGSLDLEKLKEEILSYPWTQRLPFLHYPKVEVIEGESGVRAVAIAGGTEMGGKIEALPAAPKEAEAPAGAEVPVAVANAVPAAEGAEAGDVGFFKERDVAQNIPPAVTEQSADQEKTTTAEPAGESGNFPPENISAEIQAPSKPAIRFPALGSKIAPLFRSLKLPRLALGRGVFVVLLIVLAAVLLGVGGVWAATGFMTKAKVTVYVDPQVLEPSNQEVLVVTSGEATGDNQVPGTLIETDERGSKKGVVTGKKLVGEKAKGSLTIYGNATVARTFSSGTVASANGLKFTLDGSVDIASKAGAVSQTPTASVNVTASGIGDSYNLPANTIFAIADFPSISYEGKNDTAFSGGSSHQADVVTKLDQDRLSATLSAELADKATKTLRSKLSASQNLVDKAVSCSLTQKKFDKEVDTEAENLTLSATEHCTGILFDQSGLIALMGKNASGSIPEGYELDPQLSTVDIINTGKNQDGGFTLTVHFKAGLLPKIDKGKTIQNLAGKNFTQAASYLKSLTGVVDSDINLSPGILSRFAVLPRLSRNISLEVISR